MCVNRFEVEGGSAVRIYVMALLAMVAAVSACAHTTALDPSDPEACAALTQKAARGETVIMLRNGAEREASGLLFAPDSTSWFDPPSGERQKVATSRIAGVRLANPGVGVLKGLGTGLLMGAGLGFILTLPPDAEPGGFRPSTHGATAFCGAVGGLIGAGVGAGSGTEEICYLQAASSGNTGRR